MSEESSIYKFFEEVPDYRKEDKIYYKLSDMITLTVTGVISGAETWKEIVFFGEAIAFPIFTEYIQSFQTSLYSHTHLPFPMLL